MTETAIWQTLDDVLLRLSAETARTATLFRKVEVALADLMAQPAQKGWPADLQLMDQALQRLDGLSAFCAVLRTQGTASVQLDIKKGLDVVQQESLSQALLGSAPASSPMSGEVEVF